MVANLTSALDSGAVSSSARKKSALSKRIVSALMLGAIAKGLWFEIALSHGRGSNTSALSVALVEELLDDACSVSLRKLCASSGVNRLRF